MTETPNSGSQTRVHLPITPTIGGSTDVIHVNDYCYRGHVHDDRTWHVTRWLCDRKETEPGNERLESPDIHEIPALVLISLDGLGATGTSRR